MKKLVMPLLFALLVTSCATSNQPSGPVSIPPPSAELMTPVTPSSINVPLLLLDWTQKLKDWHARQQACNDMPATCA